MWNPALAKEQRGEKSSLPWFTVLCSQHRLRQRKKGLRCWTRACSAPPGSWKGLTELKAGCSSGLRGNHSIGKLSHFQSNGMVTKRLSWARMRSERDRKELLSFVWFYCRVENSSGTTENLNIFLITWKLRQQLGRQEMGGKSLTSQRQAGAESTALPSCGIRRKDVTWALPGLCCCARVTGPWPTTSHAHLLQAGSTYSHTTTEKIISVFPQNGGDEMGAKG